MGSDHVISLPMAASEIFLLFSSAFLVLLVRVAADQLCRKLHCNPEGPLIHFPFRIRALQDDRCGYPGFDISCDDQGRAILHLPHSGDLVVNSIDYVEQLVSLGDLEGCLLKRLLVNRSFSSDLASPSSPFFAEVHRDFTLANCTWDLAMDLTRAGMARVTCLNNAEHVVVAAPLEDHLARMFLSDFRGCDAWTMIVPGKLALEEDVTELVWLKWDWPDCRGCEAAGRRSGLKSGARSSDVQFSHKGEFSEGMKFVLMTMALLLFFVGFFGGIHYLSTEANTPPNAVNGAMGIDLATLESYPKAQIDDLGQVPRPNDDVCVICLSEYQPKETFRTIPECAHYFHAHCIDQWLKRNASCPLCRKRKDI